MIFRLSYKRIVKYLAHEDMNIFMLWILKESIDFSDILQKLENNKQFHKDYNDGSDGDEAVATAGAAGAENDDDVDTELGYNPNQFCDCVYFVTEDVKEINFLFETNFKMCKSHLSPLLPGDTPDEDEDEIEEENVEEEQEMTTKKETFDGKDIKGKKDENEKRPILEKRSSRLNFFFQV